jgi:hypothetical protein
MMLDEMRREPPTERLRCGSQMPDLGMWSSGQMELWANFYGMNFIKGGTY